MSGSATRLRNLNALWLRGNEGYHVHTEFASHEKTKKVPAKERIELHSPSLDMTTTFTETESEIKVHASYAAGLSDSTPAGC
jgi:hypothetical protein